ncbi:MAG: cadherin-like beta sandwich domain-containing protein [Nitrospira sp.]|nr:cadherin-like beta sandwich domain-containing protein [Nitrospira sp.]
MRGILTFVGQCFAVVAVTIGLSSYGCMGSTTVNPVAELASLTVTPGTLQPAFTSGTTQYTVDLTRKVTSVKITAQPAVAGDTITINGQATTSSTITLGSEGSTTSVSIVVSESTNNSRTYIVLLKRASVAGNNSLASLTVSPGTLAPVFNENTLTYSVDVANNVESVTVKPTLQDSAATMTVNGEARNSGESLPPIQLGGAGSSTPIDIVVIAQNNSQKTYHVTVNRGKSGNNFLESLEISPGTLDPFFTPGTEGYTVNLPSILPGNTTSMTVTPTLQDATASMTVNGQPAPSGQAQTTPLPAPGATTAINIAVTAQNNTERTYTVTIIRAALNGNNFLSALTISPGTLTPIFNAGTEGYTVNLPSILPGNPTSMTVTPTLQDTTASMSISVDNGSPTNINSGEARSTPLPAPGATTAINIAVTAQNNTERTYTVTIIRAALSGNNNLSALTVTPPGTPIPGFSPNILTYTVNVATDVISVTVTATLEDINASMTINGQGTSSGVASAPITLGGAGSDRTITIIVIAPNGSQKIYTVTVHRASSSNSNLSALSVSQGVLDNPFDPNQLSYTVNVDSTVDSVVISATKADLQATMSSLGSVIAAPGDPDGQVLVTLGAGPSTEVVTITVIAQDMASQSPYTVTVNKAP